MPKKTSDEGRPDILLLLVTLILVSIGTVMVYSSSSILAMERFQDGLFFLKKQVLFVAIGLVVMILLAKIPYPTLKRAAYPALFFSGILLLLLFIPHVGARVGGATRWIRWGPVSFQVSELVKVCLVLYLAHYLTVNMRHVEVFMRGVLIPLALSGVLIGLIMLQPDFGTAAIISILVIFMLYLAGTRLIYLISLGALLLPVSLLLVVNKPYRLKRLMAFLDPWSDPQRSGFQIIQSLISFGSGGPFGVGLGDGMQKLFYLPEPHTDFILSVIAEESGFVGVVIIMALFALFIIRGFMIAHAAPDRFGTLLAAGLTMTIALEAFINIAGVMGLIPLKGLALPFLSYGGTSLVMSLAAVGILLNISTDKH